MVAVTVFERDIELFETLCKGYEQVTRKRMMKWSKVRLDIGLSFARLVLSDGRFAGKLFYSAHQQQTKLDYDAETISGISTVLKSQYGRKEYSAEVYVDGISQTKRKAYQTSLRQLKVKVRKVHQARDESYPLIRLADAMAGLVRDATQGQPEAKKLVEQAKKLGTLTEA